MTEHLEITDFLQHPLGLGWHLDRAKFDAMLRQEACSSGASLCSQRLRSLEPITGEAAWLLAFKDKHVKCRWLIDASGRVSFVAQKLGISRIYDDELRAIYTSPMPAAAVAPPCRDRAGLPAVTPPWLLTLCPLKGSETPSLPAPVLVKRLSRP
ncbi:MAG: tryptophan 7-halogenase [Proteobacteria bacterium]|nr:tryptophan 7-halogenase [Pseudomonadota bacterium]